ncbi:IclR family transcriptional regulator domain-containing protein [Saccharomonospora saliphila]|uniref:IclR family transcriptional regulator domain-containing protein n=1 Tax=Saccharomonospora saliphila TaxID=369829 RepID=UPI0003765394|nr:IclR family transcriptional regulator C-terminal domain-containing protein [Saccharomonospora saliphila]
MRSVERTVAVLRAFSARSPELTLTEVATTCGLDRASARRILLSLVELGYLHHDGRQYSLTPKVLEFGYAYLSNRSLPQLARPHLHQLSETVRETTALGVLEGVDVRYVLQVPSPRLLSVTIPVGTRFPAHAVSLGKALLAGLNPEELQRRLGDRALSPLTRHTVTDRAALLAELATIRREGFALSDGELEEGLRGVAVPVRDRDGQVVAAANISLDAHALSASDVRATVVPMLVRTVGRIEADLRLRAGHP